MATLPTRSMEQQMEHVSPFEIKNRLISMAKAETRCATATFLNAGRGNPNWVTTEPREAFFLLGNFAMQEARRVLDDPIGIAGSPSAEGCADRLRAFLKEHHDAAGAKMIGNLLDYMVEVRDADADELVYEWVDGILGDHYPTPDRILKYTERIVNEYLAITMGGDAPVGDFDLFATEGSTAGMCYVFDSLQRNKLVDKGDTIALMTPIFTPYIEIPELDRFNFNVVNISANRVDADGFHTWQYPDDEIDKLRDPKVKVVCLVNPSNPPSYTLSDHTLERIVDIVRHDNPGLMIVTDDVYGTFVPNFKSLMYMLPHNTMCLYSFSKYFGATGWRLAVIAINRTNIFDDKIAALPKADRAALNRRYSSLSLHPESIRFIDRMVADSRMVALNHTAGLSTPQQVMMSLFAGYCILDKNHNYRTYMQQLIDRRLAALWKTTGFTLQPDPLRAGYYSEIDLMVWARKFYGDDFANYLTANYEPLDFVIRLAQETGVVLLNGDGFDGPAWSVRASLANLNEDDYLKIGTAIRKIFDEYHTLYTQSAKATH